VSWEWSRQVLPGVAKEKDGARRLQPSADRDCKTRYFTQVCPPPLRVKTYVLLV
jgi:hypothetical protein